MRIDLSGQRALITGGARGIGAAAAAALRACGAEVYIADIDGDPPVDVRDPVALEAAFARAAPLDVVVANAGTAIFRRLDETRDEEWRRLLDINLTGAFHTVRLAAQQMKPRRRGSIVLTASTNSFDGEADLAAYNATKAGLLGLLRTAANELGPFGIRVNAVCPGLIRTDLTAAHFAQAELLRSYFATSRSAVAARRRKWPRPSRFWPLRWPPTSPEPPCWWTAARWRRNSASGTKAWAALQAITGSSEGASRPPPELSPARCPPDGC